MRSLEDALWDAFAAAENCYVDREMDVIDTGGQLESFDMRQVADHLRRALREMCPQRCVFDGGD